MSLLILLAALSAAPAAAPQDDYKPVTIAPPADDIWSRFTLGTNLIDWALVIPNISVEYDLGNPERQSTSSLYLQLKGSPSSQDYWSKGIYNEPSYQFYDARLDWHYHFTFHKHPELYRGRFYTGIYAEYMNYTLCTPLDLVDRDCLKRGWAGIAGITGGYDFPAFSYGNRHFFEFQVGGSLGLIHSDYDALGADGLSSYVRNFPMLTELRFALTYRRQSISRKYWQYNIERYTRHMAEDAEAQKQIEAMVDELNAYPLVISVRPNSDRDSLFQYPVTMKQVRNAFQQRFHSPYFLIERTYELSGNTDFPIARPNENCALGYSVLLRPYDPESQSSESHYVFPFRVRFEGYQEAYERMMSFNNALRSYYHNNSRHIPALYVEAVSSNQFTGSVTRAQVMDLINSQWKEGNLLDSEVEGIYRRENGEFQEIQWNQLDRRGTYALALRFHPQITEGADSLVCRFNLEPYVESDVQQRYESFTGGYSSKRIVINHPWLNGRERQLNSDDLLRAISRAGFEGFDESNITIGDSIHYGQNVATALFGKVLPEVPFNFYVEDPVSLAMGNKIHEAIQKGVTPRRATWNKEIDGNLTYGPRVEGHWDRNGNAVPNDPDEVITGIMRCLTRCNPQLRGQRIDPLWVIDYTHTGDHEMPFGKPDFRWTMIRFAYRFTYIDGRSRVAIANLVYRIHVPQKKKK